MLQTWSTINKNPTSQKLSELDVTLSSPVERKTAQGSETCKDVQFSEHIEQNCTNKKENKHSTHFVAFVYSFVHVRISCFYSCFFFYAACFFVIVTLILPTFNNTYLSPWHDLHGWQGVKIEISIFRMLTFRHSLSFGDFPTYNRNRHIAQQERGGGELKLGGGGGEGKLQLSQHNTQSKRTTSMLPIGRLTLCATHSKHNIK